MRQAIVVKGAGCGWGRTKSSVHVPSGRCVIDKQPAAGSHRYSSLLIASNRCQRRDHAWSERRIRSGVQLVATTAP